MTSGGSGGEFLLLEAGFGSPHGPDDARELVGQRDGGLVVTAELLKLEGPGAQAIGSGQAMGVAEDGAGAVDEEHAEVRVTTLADRAEVTGGAAGVFAGSEAEVVGEAAAGAEAVDIADEGEQRGGGEQTDAGDGTEAGHDGEVRGEGGELAFEGAGVGFELLDLGAGVGEGGMQGGGQGGIGPRQELADLRQDEAGAQRDHDAELAQEAAQGIEAGGAGGEPGGAQAVESGERLLIHRLDGDGVDVLVAESFEESAGVSAVGLVAQDVGAGGMGRQENDLVAIALGEAGPEVGRAAGFEEHGGGGQLGEEGTEAGAGEAAALVDVAGLLGDSDFEDCLGEVDGNGRTIHGGLLPGYVAYEAESDNGTSMPSMSREESIPSLEPTPFARHAACGARRPPGCGRGSAAKR